MLIAVLFPRSSPEKPCQWPRHKCCRTVHPEILGSGTLLTLLVISHLKLPPNPQITRAVGNTRASFDFPQGESRLAKFEHTGVGVLFVSKESGIDLIVELACVITPPSVANRVDRKAEF